MNAPKLRFRDDDRKDFPVWRPSKVSDLNLYISDGNYGEQYPTAAQMVSSGIPFIRANNIKEQRLIWDGMRFISPEQHAILTSGHLLPNDILITTRGEIGSAALVQDEFGGSNINAQICLLRIQEQEKILPSFLIQELTTNHCKKQFKELQTGSALKQLPKSSLVQLSLSIPCKAEQQKIASFLSSVDQKITLLTQKHELLVQYKKGVMQKIFNQEIRFKDKNGKDFPGWKHLSLSGLGQTFNGLSGKTADDFGDGAAYVTYKQIFDSSKINPSKFGLVKINNDEKQNKALFGDLFFTTSSETPNEVGYCSALLDDIEDLYLNSFCFGFRIDSFEVLSPQYARFMFFSSRVREAIVLLAQGSTRYNISKTSFMKIKVPVPVIEEQIKIYSFLDNLESTVALIAGQIELTKQYKQGLLQQMFI